MQTAEARGLSFAIAAEMGLSDDEIDSIRIAKFDP